MTEILAKIFLFEKNEMDILKALIEHHAKIVGYNNITIIDHNSNDGSFSLAKSYSYKGLTVIRYTGAYTNKGRMMTSTMNKVKNLSTLMIPLDADEFLVTHRDNKISKKPEHVIADLKSVAKRKNIGRFKFHKIYNFINTSTSSELKNLTHFRVADYTCSKNKHLPKVFFRSTAFNSTDMGNHDGSINSKFITNISKNISLMHYQVRGLDHFIKKNKKSENA